MKLVKFDYTEFVGEPKEWTLRDCTFANINLIVGLNAIGKTRTLNVISALAHLLSETTETKWSEGNYAVDFKHNDDTLSYVLEYHDHVVQKESLKINSTEKLTRGANGEGRIYAEDIQDQPMIRFRVPEKQVAASAKRDSIQHPFLEYLYQWAKGLIRYNFSTPLGKDHFFIVSEQEEKKNDVSIDLRQTQRVVEIFLRGSREYGDDFIKAVLNDLISIGYNVEDVGVDIVPGVSIQPINISAQALGIYVKEVDRNDRTYQPTMSQGMFRALSVLIQVNYSLMASEPSCILIDDIGEGLDFSRSSALTTMLINKIKNSQTQLIMATNDRFVMNSVPLQYWIIMNRQGGECTHYSYRNAKEIFDEFELTGLSNFDLFSTHYYLQGKNGE